MRKVIVVALIGLGFGLVLKFTGGGSPVGTCMLIALVGIPIATTLATIDDDFPGGWSNPDGKSRPPWLHWHTLVQLALMGSISGFGFAIDSGAVDAAFALWLLLGAAGVVGTQRFLRYVGREGSA